MSLYSMYIFMLYTAHSHSHEKYTYKYYMLVASYSSLPVNIITQFKTTNCMIRKITWYWLTHMDWLDWI